MPSSNVAPGLRPPLVLVVDDYEDTRILYAETLRFAGFDVAEAANGREAVEIAEELRPDVVGRAPSAPRVWRT